VRGSNDDGEGLALCPSLVTQSGETAQEIAEDNNLRRGSWTLRTIVWPQRTIDGLAAYAQSGWASRHSDGVIPNRWRKVRLK
jgi:hypothetical protein